MQDGPITLSIHSAAKVRHRTLVGNDRLLNRDSDVAVGQGSGNLSVSRIIIVTLDFR
jgi:hypothetical protein